MSFTNVLFWIIAGYVGYYAALIAWEYYKNKRMGKPSVFTTEVFNPKQERESYMAEEGVSDQPETTLQQQVVKPEESDSGEDTIQPVICCSEGISAEVLVSRLNNAAERGDWYVNDTLGELGAEWSRISRMSA